MPITPRQTGTSPLKMPALNSNICTLQSDRIRRLVCIDPITAYMGGRTDSHKATEVRAQLGPLKDLAERTNVAISTITHPPKNSGQRALDQYIGSQAFIAACRIGHLCIPEMKENADGEHVPTGRVLFSV